MAQEVTNWLAEGAPSEPAGAATGIPAGGGVLALTWTRAQRYIVVTAESGVNLYVSVNSTTDYANGLWQFHVDTNHPLVLTGVEVTSLSIYGTGAVVFTGTSSKNASVFGWEKV